MKCKFVHGSFGCALQSLVCKRIDRNAPSQNDEMDDMLHVVTPQSPKIFLNLSFKDFFPFVRLLLGVMSPWWSLLSSLTSPVSAVINVVG